MQDCLIPLDIAFLDEEGHVLQIDTLDAPADPDVEPARARRLAPSVMVLEMRAGFFQEHSLAEGSRVVLPATVRREDADR